MASDRRVNGRALLIVLDSVGIGGAPDALAYGDEGAATLPHIFERVRDLRLPHLDSLGLRKILGEPNESSSTGNLLGSFGRMQERSAGKDTTTGHWEIAGAILEEPFATFEKFPPELVDAIESEAGVKFIGNYPRSGTAILEELGDEHCRTADPILYTSADSVLQIAAHENVISVERLYQICQIARRHTDRFKIGRVIARPFEGKTGHFQRTSRRHDYSMRPPDTILAYLKREDIPVTGIGKINDIFAGEGISVSHPTASNAEGMAQIERLWETARGLLFANLVDFDMLHGHRRDVNGYAQALREFDHWLGHFLPAIRPNDLFIITADHGNDPTFRGTDHTREQVPLFVLHGNLSRDLGTRETFADIASSLAKFFGLAPWKVGAPFI